MSFVYDIKKQLLLIGEEFENKFIKSAQSAEQKVDMARLHGLAIKMLDNLESSLSVSNKDVYPKDLKDFDSLIRFLASNEEERDGKRIVYIYRDINSGFDNLLGAEFGSLNEEDKKEYSPYPSNEPRYMIHKILLETYLNELLDRAVTEKNKIVEVMIGKRIEDANRLLNLNFKRVNNQSNSNSNSSQSNQTPDKNNQGDNKSSSQANNGGSNTPDGTNGGVKNPEQASDELLKQLKTKLGGVNPLAADQINIPVIVRFFEFIMEMLQSNYFFGLMAAETGSSTTSANFRETVINLQGIARNGLDLANALNQQMKSVIYLEDVTGLSGGENNVEKFLMAVQMKDPKATYMHASNKAKELNKLLETTYYAEERLIRQEAFLQDQRAIKNNWINHLSKLSNDALIADRSQNYSNNRR